MNKDQKALVISLIPIFIALIFLIYVLAPALIKMRLVNEKLGKKQQEISTLNSNMEQAKSKEKIVEEVNQMQMELKDFDTNVPSDDELAIFLVDMKKFAQNNNVKVLSLDLKQGKEIELTSAVDSAKEKLKRKSGERVKKKILPLKLTSLPIEVRVLGYYNDIHNFINDIEKYKRSTIIEGVEIKDFEDDKGLAQPRIEMKINCLVFKANEQEVPKDDSSSDSSNKAASDSDPKTLSN